MKSLQRSEGENKKSVSRHAVRQSGRRRRGISPKVRKTESPGIETFQWKIGVIMDTKTKMKIIDSLKERLEDEKAPVRHTAVRALSMFKESVEITIPILLETVVEGDKQERARAYENLIAIGEPAIEPVIETLLTNEHDQDARLSGIGILMSIYEEVERKEKKEEDTCEHQKDPHGLGLLMRGAVTHVLEETLRSFIGEKNEAKVENSG
jgi:hypothetical protein